MITTITLNPALDKTCFGERMCPGQVNRMDRVRNLPGGKGINVTRVLAGYGFPVRAMGDIQVFLLKTESDSFRQNVPLHRFPKAPEPIPT